MSLSELSVNDSVIPKLGLNEKQLEAVLYFGGPLLILAGAGTGKTKTLVSKIALLINSGITPSGILAITFTNKAAGEMRDRIARLAPESAGVWMYTFHSFGARLLRQHYKLAGLKNDFVIYDEDDQKKLINLVIAELGFEKEKNKAALYASIISRAKDDLLDSESYLLNARAQGDPNRIKAAQIYFAYQKKLAESNAVDFGDLIVKPVELLKNNNDLREYYEDCFRYLLVDEYQDTNRAQYVLVKTLSNKHKNLCVVGDPDQSIYAWRGADIRNILEFEKDFKDSKTIVLEQNYRSTSVILDSANRLIKHNRGRKDKNLWTENPKGEKIETLECMNEIDEATAVLTRTKEMGAKGFTYNNIAIFYRTNAQSRNFEEAFRRARIPYRLIGSVRFYERREIKDALAYLKIMTNPFDTVSLMRVLNTPHRGIGAKAQERILEYSKQRGMPFYDALLTVDQIPDLSPGVRKSSRDFLNLFEEIKSDMFTTEPHQLLEKVLARSGYWQMIEDNSEKDPQDTMNRLGNLQELVNAVKEFEDNSKRRGISPTLSKYLEEVMLQSEVDKLNEKTEAVTLMTIHLAKGLEFPVVFLTGLEDGLFPINAAAADNDDMEEERRLMYVGMTRAKKKLFISWANTRRVFGKTYPNLMSRFIIEAGLSEYTRGESGKEETEIIESYSASKPKLTLYRKVIHPVYGTGKITHVTGTGEFTKVTVVFDSGIRQTFMLKYAPLEII